MCAQLRESQSVGSDDESFHISWGGIVFVVAAAVLAFAAFGPKAAVAGPSAEELRARRQQKFG